MSSSKHLKIKEHKLLTNYITYKGVKMPSYSYYKKQGLYYLTSTSLKWCNKCVCLNSYNYNVSSPSTSN
jgi:hypothetical protein